MTSESKDEQMIYGLTADEHIALQRDLHAMPMSQLGQLALGYWLVH